MILYNEMGDVLASDDNGGGDLSSKIDYTFSSSGTYFLLVGEKNTNFGPMCKYDIEAFYFPSCSNPIMPPNGGSRPASDFTLQWTEVPGALSYDIYFGDNPNPPFLSNTKKEQYLITGLIPGKTYYWKIIPKNPAGSPNYCPIWYFTTTGCEPPSCGNNPNPADFESNISIFPILTWSSNNATYFDVYFGTNQNPPYIDTTYQNSYYPGILNQNTTYYWKIIPKNNCGTATNCPIWRFTTICNIPSCAQIPDPPNGASNISTSTIISWEQVPEATSYDLYFGVNPNPPFVANIYSNYYYPGKLNANTTYYWKVISKNNCGSSSSCPVWNFTTRCGTLDVPTPINVNGQSCSEMIFISDPTPVLTYSNVENEVHYEIQVYSGSCGGTLVYSMGADKNITSVEVNEPLQNGTYYWRVRANGDGTNYCDSDWSQCCTFIICTGSCPDGTLKWKFYPTVQGPPSTPAIGNDGTIYFASGWNIYAFSSDGTEKWHKQIATSTSLTGNPAINESGTIYVLGDEDPAKLFAINSTNGNIIWTYQSQSYIARSTPSIGYDGTIYFFAYDGKMYAINSDSSLKWVLNFMPSQTPDIDSSSVISSNGIIYINIRGTLFAISPAGEILWQNTLSEYSGSTATPAIANDGSIFLNVFYFLYKVIPSNGSIICKNTWSTYSSGLQPSVSPAIAPNGTVYVSGYENGIAKLYAFNSDCSLKCSYSFSEPSSSSYLSSPAISADGTVFIGIGAKLYAIKPNCTLKWSASTGDNIRSSPNIAIDGTIYFSSDDGYFYAYNSNAGGLAGGQWPKFKFDIRNSGNLQNCFLPFCSSNPNPSDGATGITSAPLLSWSSVPGATSYDIYFGTSSNPAYIINVSSTSWTPGSLNLNTTYYWKVVPKSDCGNALSCSIWHFTTESASCNYLIDPANQLVPSSGGNYSFTITATSGCSWTTSSDSSWITITSGSSGSGNGSGSYTVASNSGSSRTGHIYLKDNNGSTVGTLTIAQEGTQPPPSNCTDGFEDGDYTSNPQWTIGQSGNPINPIIEVTSSAAKNGSYGLKMQYTSSANWNDEIYLVAASNHPSSVAIYEAWIFFADNQTGVYFTFTNSSGSDLIGVNLNAWSGAGVFRGLINGAWENNGITVLQNYWYKLKVIFDPTSQTVDYYLYDINMNELGHISGLAASGTISMAKLRLTVGETDTRYVYFDDVTFCSSSSTCQAELGDVNMNSNITSYDCSFILQYVVGQTNLNPDQICRADTNENSNVTSMDASYCLQCVVNNCQNLPANFLMSCQNHGHCQ